MTFSRIVRALDDFWEERGCVLGLPYNSELGAGTFNPLTFLKTLKPGPWRAAYVDISRRPKDGRYGENPIRFQQFHQYQVILKPAPDDVQEQYLNSLGALGIETCEHDVRFVEDNWESPSLAASGVGWEVWLDGMEVTQFTYFQQLGGLEPDITPVELTYGLERLAVFIQGREECFGLEWSSGATWEEMHREAERQFSRYNFDLADPELYFRLFADYETECRRALDESLVIVAYDLVIKMSHVFNLLDARGVISASERAAYIGRIRKLAKECARAYVQSFDLGPAG